MRQVDVKSMVIGLLFAALVFTAVAASGGCPVKYELFNMNVLTTSPGSMLKIMDGSSAVSTTSLLKLDTETGRVWALTERNNKTDKWIEIK